MDSDQKVVNKELALSLIARSAYTTCLWGYIPMSKVTPVILHGVVSGVTLHMGLYPQRHGV